MRTIVVNGVVWKWRHGREAVVAKCPSTGERRVRYASDMLGLHPDTWDKDRRDGSSHTRVTPKHIADWLSKPPGPEEARLFPPTKPRKKGKR
jgi:hypothetical protein